MATALAVDVLATTFELPRLLASRDVVLADVADERLAGADVGGAALFVLVHPEFGLLSPHVAALGLVASLPGLPLLLLGLALSRLVLLRRTSLIPALSRLSLLGLTLLGLTLLGLSLLRLILRLPLQLVVPGLATPRTRLGLRRRL